MAIGRSAVGPGRTGRRRDAETLRDRAVDLIRETVEDADVDGIVVALSGGVDSATTAALAVEALGPERVYALLLPTADTRERDTRDAREWADSLGIDSAVVSLEPAMGVFKRHLAPRIAPAGDEYAAGNLAARLRMAACYFVANADDRLVVGTSNRTERLLGYFTKHGDGGADVFPLGEYDKGEVRALAAHLGVPEPIREKRPTAGFWDGQTDEADLGAPYETLDEVVAALADGAVGVRAPDTVAETVDADPDTVVTQAARIRRTGHKRERPPAPGRPEADIDATADTASGGSLVDTVASFVRDRVERADADGVVVPVSGDLDSSVTAGVATEAVGAERVYGLHLPCHKAGGFGTPDPGDLATDLGFDYDRVNVRPLVTELEAQLPHEVTARAGVEELGNLVARVRMACAYYVANTTTTLVLGTCDRTERMLGTVTKYGDDAADVHPLGGLYRTEVVALGRELGLPDRVVDQPSTLESAIGRREEAAFGASFDVIDAVLERLVDRDIGIERTAEELDVDQEVVRRFAGDHVRTKHKRAMPPTTAQRVGPGAFHELELKFE